MKRKLALLLAVAMMLSLLPQVSLFASSENSLSKVPTTTSERTQYVESDLLPADLKTTVLEIDKNADSSIKNVVDGTYLQIKPKNDISAKSTIKLQLENARWNFTRGNATSDKWNGLITGSALTKMNYPGNKADIIESSSNNSGRRLGEDNVFHLYRTYRKYVYETTDGSHDVAHVSSTTKEADIIGGIVGVDFTGSYPSGTYIRFADASLSLTSERFNVTDPDSPLVSTPIDRAVLYTLTVSTADPTVATVVFPNDLPYAISSAMKYDTLSGYNEKIIVPVVARSTKDDSRDVKISITDTNTTSITGGSFVFGTTSDTLTNTYVDDPQTARDEFPMNRIVIKEQRVASMGNGTFRISAPSGFEFSSDALNDVVVVAENFGYGTSEVIAVAANSTAGVNPVNTADATIRWRQTRNENDYSAIEVVLGNLSEYKSDRVAGTLYIADWNDLQDVSNHTNHLRLIADDGAAWGDINMSISNVDKTPITPQTFVGGIRKDWTIALEALGDIPTLVNGRYQQEDSIESEDSYHLAATVSFKENSVNAWWSGRVTNFELPEGVKVRKAEIIQAKKVVQKDELINADRSTQPYDEKYYMNTGKKDGYVTINGNVLSISNVQVETNEKADVQMKLWLSIESGYEGDVTLTATGSAISEEVDPIVIAKAVSPIEIKTTVTDVKIGYQYYPVADVEIIETASGMLEKDKQVWITATDRINTDMYFTPGFKWEVTEGNLKIKDVDLGTGRKIVVGASGKITNNASADLGSGTIIFDVSSASSTASTIKFSNLQLKIDRTVPESSDTHYSVYAWGPNIAPNANVFDYSEIYDSNNRPNGYLNYVGNDQHSSIGIKAPYIRVVTSATGRETVLSSVVKVTVGSGTAYVNGEPITIDPSPFIDSATSRMMVPVRAVSYLLGIQPGQVIWSDPDHTVTVNMEGRIIQFTIGSDIFLINGAQVRMDTAAMIVDGRTYIPFRYLGDALGVQVGYDDTTKTATYNADKENK